MITEAFSPSCDSAPTTPLPPRQQAVSHSLILPVFVCRWPNILTGGGGGEGVEEEPTHMTARKSGLL
jgi:hypothetical protein